MSSQREQIKKKRQVLERVVDVVKVIGKRGLSYRSRNDAAYMLEDINVDHGNFLEIILLLSKYDLCLKEHVAESIDKSKKMHQSGAKGRGSMVMLLSARTINSIIATIQQFIQGSIVEDITKAGMFSVQIETSQDQCSVVLRYVTDTVHERLVTIVKCRESTGQYFVNMLSEVANKLKLDLSKCIEHATGGASHMQRHYKESPNQVHV